MTEKKMCVYVCEMENGTVKIGISSNFKKRKNELYNATGMKILKSCHSEYISKEQAKKIESELHEIFAQSRKGGEFFSEHFSRVIAALQTKIPLAFIEDSDHHSLLDAITFNQIEVHIYLCQYVDEVIYVLERLNTFLEHQPESLNECFWNASETITAHLDTFSEGGFDSTEILRGLDYIKRFIAQGSEVSWWECREAYSNFVTQISNKLRDQQNEWYGEVLEIAKWYVAELKETQKKGHHLLNGSFYKKCDGTKMRENEVKKFREEVDRGIDRYF